MANVSIPEVKKDLPVIEQIKEGVPYASNLMVQDLMGLAVNPDRLKTAKFNLNLYKSLLVLDKENRKVKNAEMRFGYKVIADIGSEDDKQNLKALVSSVVKQFKIIDKE